MTLALTLSRYQGSEEEFGSKDNRVKKLRRVNWLFVVSVSVCVGLVLVTQSFLACMAVNAELELHLPFFLQFCICCCSLSYEHTRISAYRSLNDFASLLVNITTAMFYGKFQGYELSIVSEYT